MIINEKCQKFLLAMIYMSGLTIIAIIISSDRNWFESGSDCNRTATAHKQT